jgi:N-acetyldiaminopimelate deacetylase
VYFSFSFLYNTGKDKIGGATMKSYTEIRRDLHRIPELGFQEYKTQAYLLEYLQSIATEFMELQLWRTGILVRIEGKNPSKTIGYRADIDGLPITEDTGYEFASTHEGMMHACGHDIHMTIGLGVVTELVKERIDDHVVVLFQPAEEGPGGALPMIQSEEFQAWKPDMIVGLHIAPEYPVGTIATKEGLLFANTSELYIDLKGKGGHAAYPHNANDMVVAASYLVTQLQSIIARNVDPLDSAVITVGKITGGTVQNVIAEKARLEGTIRTLSVTSMQKVKERIEAVVKGIEASFQCEATIDYGAMYHQVYNNEALTKEFMMYTTEASEMNLIECKEAMTGEDFGYMIKDIPGFMFWLGVDSEYGLHHAKLKPREEVIEKTISFLSSYVRWKGNK